MVTRLKEGLAGKGIQAKVIYSGGVDVDILAAGASKGDGLKFLLKQVQLPGYQVLQSRSIYGAPQNCRDAMTAEHRGMTLLSAHVPACPRMGAHHVEP